MQNQSHAQYDKQKNWSLYT